MSSTGKDFNYLCYLSLEEWYKIPNLIFLFLKTIQYM